MHKNNSVKHAQKTANSDHEPMVTDFGNRAISTQNFSKIVALPKTALINCGINTAKINVKLVQQDGEKYIKLTPVGTVQTETGDGKNV